MDRLHRLLLIIAHGLFWQPALGVNTAVQISGVANMTNTSLTGLSHRFEGLQILSMDFRHILYEVFSLFSGTTSAYFPTTAGTFAKSTSTGNQTNSTDASDSQALPWYTIFAIALGSMGLLGLAAGLGYYFALNPSKIGYRRLTPEPNAGPPPSAKVILVDLTRQM